MTEARLPDLENMARGWFLLHGFADPSLRPLTADEETYWGGSLGVIVPPDTPDWERALDRADYWGDGGDFPLGDLIGRAAVMGFALEPVCTSILLVSPLEDLIPF